MWRSTRHQTTWIQICVFTFMYSSLGSYSHTNEYYIMRGFGDQVLSAQVDVFGYPDGSASCLIPASFNSESFTVSWPSDIKLCTYRCGIYSNNDSEGAYTFLPDKKECLRNTQVRTRLNGCMMLFVGEFQEQMKSPLFVLDLNDSSKFQALESTKLRKHCKIVGQHYYDSSGNWENIPTSCITFYIQRAGRHLLLRWNSVNATPYMGRIIRLQLQNCRKSWPGNFSDCIVFKAKGIFHYQPTFVTSLVKLEPCPTPSTSYVKVSHSSTSPNLTTMASPLIPSTSEQVSVVITSTSYVKVSHSLTSPNVTTMALPLIPSTSEQVSVVITSTSYVKVSHSLTSPNVTTMALPLIPSKYMHVSVVMTSINTPTTSAQTEGPTTPLKGDPSGQESSNKESVIIGVITTCVIVVIICLLVAVWCKRRSNHKNRSSLKANPSANNPAYEQNNQIIPLSSTQKKPQVNEDYDNIEYDYAAVDGVQVHTNNKQQPVYQSLDRGNEKVPQIYQSLMNNPDLKKPGLNKDNADSKKYSSYNHLQHPTYNPPHPKDTSNSLYNSLQKPGNEKVPQIYQSLNNPDLKNPDNADSKGYSYNHLQHPTYNPHHPKDTSKSSYNSLQKPGGDDDYLEPETQIIDNQPGAPEPVYNVLEGPDGNPAPQDNDPVYNVLEDPDANEYPQDNDPVYNVLEDPDANEYPQDNDPVYNVLEDPDVNQYPQDNDPVYNVLEDPDANQYPQDNDPVYNVLEGPDDDYDNAPIDDDEDLPAPGQDNIAYSSTIDLKIPQTPSSPDYDVLEDPDGALPDSTYQPLGMRVPDDVYQPLDRTSQSIYQSLEPNDSTA